MTGVCVDRDRLHDLSKSFAGQLDILERQIHDLAGETFNINSSQQLGRILFEELNLPVQKKTKKKTGYSTDVEVLTTLARSHELPALVLRHRTLAKLKSTYADALLDLIHPETGRIHTSFNQTVAATGRLSSSDPNLQNIPIRTEEGREIRRLSFPGRAGGCFRRITPRSNCVSWRTAPRIRSSSRPSRMTRTFIIERPPRSFRFSPR